MKRLCNIVWACILLLGTCANAYAGTPGSSCEDAIEMGSDYSAQVRQGQSLWYSAWTFDLPLTVTFAPKYGQGEPAPDVELDFTCTPGIYEDSILCSMFCPTSNGGGLHFDMPHNAQLSSKTLDNGTFVYYLALGKQYRDLLLQMGISYNLQVYVKVTYKCAGTISMAPDDLFANCVDGAKFMHLGDTVRVKANDKKRHVIVPYVQWQEDTIRYKWTGTSSCQIAVSNDCDFDPTNTTDGKILDYAVLQPGDSLTVTAALLAEYVDPNKYRNEAGLYFAKFYSAAPGVIKIIKAPRAQAKANATLLRHGRTYALNANETAAFAIPKSWDDDTLHTMFTTPTDHVFRMTIATDPDFSEAHTLKVYQFDKSKNGHSQGVYASEMCGFWDRTTDQYLYVRFDCSESTTITVDKWQVASCITSTKNYLPVIDTTFVIPSRSNGGNYRVNYSKIAGGDLTITFSAGQKRQTCAMYIATDCNILLLTDAANVLYSATLQGGNTPHTITAEQIASWASRVDQDGYIYMRFNHQLNGQFYLTFESSAPADVDPEYPKTTIAVACEGTTVVVNVSEAQHIAIKSTTDAIVDQWDATPGVAHTLTLPAGKYTLEGENEQIEINL